MKAKKHNSIISLFLALVLTFGSFSILVTPSFSEGVTEFEFSEVMCAPGETVNVPVLISNNPGIATFRFRISYDTSALELIDITKGSALNAGTLTFTENEQNKNATFLWYSVNNVYGNGEVAVLTFKMSASAGGDYPIEVTYLEQDVLNENYSRVIYTVKGGKIFTGCNTDGHSLTKVPALAPTHFAPGNIEYYVCSVCNRLFADKDAKNPIVIGDTVIPMQEHSYSSVYFSNSEKHWRVCECGNKSDENPHVEVIDPAVAPGCETIGYTEGRHCDVCGYVIVAQTTVPFSGHSWSNWVTTKEPEYGVPGEKMRSCSVCGKVEKEVLPALGADQCEHTYGEWSVKTAPTCTSEGVENCFCVKCGTAETRPIPMTDHTYGDWVITTEPTCVTEGSQTKHCTACGTSITQPVPAKGHKYIAAVTAPTCTQNGYTTYTCACGDSYVSDATSALGHSFGEWVVTTAPGCVTEGEEKRTCSNCNIFETQVVPATGGHIFGEWVVTTEPTVFAKGEQTRKCENCEATETEEIEKLEMTNPFTDVKDGKWYTEGILWCYYSGYMAGTSETIFDYKGNVTRAMFVTILAKIDGADTSSYSKMSFTDVKPGQWYSNAIEWAASNGYAAGLGEGIFGYKQNVSREQIAMFFYTYSEKNSIDVSARANLATFADNGRIHGYAMDALSWAVAKGLISGTSETTLSPRDSATRAEIALIVKNYIETVKN